MSTNSVSIYSNPLSNSGRVLDLNYDKVKLFQNKKKQIFIILAVLRRRLQRVVGPPPKFSAWATQLQETSQRWQAVSNTVFNLTGPGIEPKTSRDNIAVLNN